MSVSKTVNLNEGATATGFVFRQPQAENGGGVEWYIVEQEGHPTLSAMNAAKACLDGLKRLRG